MSSRSRHIAVIGSGISGIVAAHILQQKHRITLFEKNDYLGGHTRTVTIPHGRDQGLAVDTGFIVLNRRTYPNLLRFFRQLDVAVAKTDMAFSYWDRAQDFYSAGTGWAGLLAQPRNLKNPRFLRLILGIPRFLAQTRKKLLSGALKGLTLNEYLQREGFSAPVIHDFVLPMAAAIWSTPTARVGDFPAESFARFYDNHGLLSLIRRPSWYYVRGGSHRYVQAFLKRFTGTVLTGHPVREVRRHADAVTVVDHNGTAHSFDAVVIAAHADEALAMLADPSDDERALLSQWQYNRNRTVLHRDPSYLPPKSGVWAAWNFLKNTGPQGAQPLTLTYYMNRLQKLPTPTPYCVTLNPFDSQPVQEEVAAFDDTHPMYTFEAMETQKNLDKLNGVRRTYFCGAYFGYGFHEDGVRSALAVARHFGLEL
ncbi:Predicted NAD/FAD-binding protein [Desulfacinum infernum DSM 9756]|uniref:Predicted NAD/FAD-binding protein n=1 Tax=Desulfacinum infernum DSM 9756 TaxID=1121391 RepID=A0A1M5FUU2_9BACT|nr:FAD-dependent oxidoreductase [Desulfacinum infernum]SHF95305.1 Predicted NAD/FAD-binding protein [Desulfacinum infernum DSM 9756]